MVLVRRIRKRGANIVVEAHGEVLFLPTGDVGRWTNRFSQRIRVASEAEAPINKRPRWGHYGKPLKATFTASTTYQPGRLRVYSAIGSTAPHAYYVDQGTGVFAGKGPYLARVIPPWTRGSPSLYESTWRAGPKGPRAAPVLIKGQKGQHFFEKGIKRGFQSMRMRSYQVPGEGASNMSAALRAVPSGLADFLGNTPPDAGFRASLAEWRAWRDTAYNAGRLLGKGSTSESRRRASRRLDASARRREAREGLNATYRRERRRRRSKERSQARRDAIKAANAERPKPKKPKPVRDPGMLTRSQDRARVKALAIRRFGADNIEDIDYSNGRWTVIVKTRSPLPGTNKMRNDFKSYSIPAKS